MKKGLVFTVLTYCFWTVCFLDNGVSSSSVEPPLYVAAFNIQNLGQTKLANQFVMGIITKIVLRYDLILIQEIVTKKENILDEMLSNINREASSSELEYEMELSPRLGSTSAQEQYAYIYRKQKLRVVRSEVFPDKERLFERPPFMTHFASPSTKDLTKFVAIGIHTQPRRATAEISALAQVYDYAKKSFKIADAILMGDMNAGCGNVRLQDWPNIDLWTRQEFLWLIDHNVDTTNAHSCCPYDRFVIAGNKMQSAVIQGHTRPFHFSKEYNLSSEQATRVSDHAVIEMKIRGKLSKMAQRVNAKACFSVEDQRLSILPTEHQLLELGFLALSDSTCKKLQWLWSTETSKMADITNRLRIFRDRAILSSEVLDTVVYKSNHGALSDSSTFADVPRVKFGLEVRCSVTGKCEIRVCRDMAIN